MALFARFRKKRPPVQTIPGRTQVGTTQRSTVYDQGLHDPLNPLSPLNPLNSDPGYADRGVEVIREAPVEQTPQPQIETERAPSTSGFVEQSHSTHYDSPSTSSYDSGSSGSSYDSGSSSSSDSGSSGGGGE